MVEYHIDNDCDAAFVTFVDQGFQVFRLAIGLIDCKIECRVIAPTLVPLELRYRHQLDRIDTEVLKIIQTFLHALEGALGSIVVHPQLVDDQVVLFRAPEVQRSFRPLVLRFIGLDNRHITAVCTAFRIIDQRRVDLLGLPFIIRMQHFLRIQIADLLLHAVRTLHCILETILFARFQIGKCDPEIITVLFHLVCVVQFPIGHIADHEHVLSRLGLAACIGTERHFGRIVGIVVDTVGYARRTRSCHNRCRGEVIPNVRVLFAEPYIDITVGRGLTLFLSVLSIDLTVMEHEYQGCHLCAGRDLVEIVQVVDHQLPFVITQTGQFRSRSRTP